MTTTAKLFIYPREMRIPPKLKRLLQDGGYIVVPEDEAGSIRVIEPLPDFQLNDGEMLWMIRTLLDLVQNDTYSSGREKLGKLLLKRVQDKVAKAVGEQEPKPILQLTEKAK